MLFLLSFVGGLGFLVRLHKHGFMRHAMGMQYGVLRSHARVRLVPQLCR
jgi:hypothetical protein